MTISRLFLVFFSGPGYGMAQFNVPLRPPSNAPASATASSTSLPGSAQQSHGAHPPNNNASNNSQPPRDRAQPPRPQANVTSAPSTAPQGARPRTQPPLRFTVSGGHVRPVVQGQVRPQCRARHHQGQGQAPRGAAPATARGANVQPQMRMPLPHVDNLLPCESRHFQARRRILHNRMMQVCNHTIPAVSSFFGLRNIGIFFYSDGVLLRRATLLPVQQAPPPQRNQAEHKRSRKEVSNRNSCRASSTASSELLP